MNKLCNIMPSREILDVLHLAESKNIDLPGGNHWANGPGDNHMIACPKCNPDGKLPEVF